MNRKARLIGWIDTRLRGDPPEVVERRPALENAQILIAAIPGLDESQVAGLSRHYGNDAMRGELYRSWPEALAAARTQPAASRAARDAYDAMYSLCSSMAYRADEFFGLDPGFAPAMGAARDVVMATALEGLLPEECYLEMTAPWRVVVGPPPRVPR